ncbi:MAG: hypothetical protein GY861_20470 [bacterium]|nr:hypothetical protein [bacterium]
MCWCNPKLRTPCCGSIDCVPTKSSKISNNTILEQSQLALWQSYCDKKMECEVLRDMLKDCSVLLVQGTEEHCTQLADQINKYLQEK